MLWNQWRNGHGFKFFHAMEMGVREHIREDSCIEGLVDVISDDIDVLFHWKNLQELLLDEERAVLLKVVASKCINLRGHSFAASILETFKQETKCTIQKSKALRKKLS